MRCYSCRKYDNCELSWKCSSTMYDCSAYELEQTNEEWLKQANTEQLANVLFEYRYINATPQQQLWLSANEDFVKGGIVEWLKQPHT